MKEIKPLQGGGASSPDSAREFTERKYPDKALVASELRYRRLFESARDGILILDAETGMIVDVNPFLVELLGYSREAFLRKEVWELGFFKDIIGNRDNFAELQAKEYIRYDDKALETCDGRRIEVEFVSNVYLANGHKVIQCNIRDISARKRVEAELNRERDLWRALLDNSKDKIYFKDLQSRFVKVSKAMAIQFGVESPEAMVGKTDFDLFTDAHARPAFEDEQRIIRTGQPVIDLEEQEVWKDGRVTWVSSTKLPWLDDKGKIIGIMGVSHDITERKQVEESHTLLAKAVEQAAETVMITDTKGTILYTNPAFEKTTGYTCVEALGQNPRILKSGKHDAEFYRQMWELIKRGEIWNGHFINRRKDGTFYEEEVTISPVRDTAGTIINYVAVKRDVTHEMQLEAQFRQAQKMEAIGQLAGGVAHDFNNILAVIQLQAGLLQEDPNVSPLQLNIAGEIEKAAQRAANLTRQLLLFSRKQVLQLRDLDLSKAITGITKMLQRILGEDVAMQFKFSPQPLWVHADPGMMDQILMNLTVNARDAMSRGGSLVIQTAAVEFDEITALQNPKAQPGAFACVSVTDTGGGIAPGILSRIFDPFFTTKDVGKGTGLGLATVFGIVQQHHGWINVYSEVGCGTTFRVYLPRLPVPVDKKDSGAEPAAIRGGTETILLVEDEAALRAAMRKVLSQLGYRVLEASTGAAALEVWKQNRAEIRLLLTDLIMPGGLSGKELAKQLLRQDSKLKVVYASGYNAEVAGKGFLLEEGVNFLPKPFEAHRLAQIVRNCLDRI